MEVVVEALEEDDEEEEEEEEELFVDELVEALLAPVDTLVDESSSVGIVVEKKSV